MIKYRFYITIGSSVTEVFPLNFLETFLVDSQKDNEAFYRRTFQGTLTFHNNLQGDDFDLIYAANLSDPCADILLEIERLGDPYWNGVFSPTDGRFDLDHCAFEVTPRADDDYVDILDNVAIQYNILSIPTVVSTNAYVSGVYDEDYTRNRWLVRIGSDSVLEYLADLVSPGATVVSTFFTDSPDNYVTLDTNHLLYLTIAQKSDILRPVSTDPATTAMMSWKELMEILWTMFQVQWDYDPIVNEFTVEHISYFTPAAGMNLTTQELAKNNKYSYLKEKMPKYEKFNFMEADNVDFVGVPIYYDSSCIDTDPDTNVRESSIKVTTDIEYIIDNADSTSNAISDEGFVILCNYEDGGNYFVESEWGVLSGIVHLNNHLSWSNLQWKYFRHNRVLIEGYINNLPLTFWTAIKTKYQDCYAVVCPDDNYDPADYITTELGETWFAGEKAKVQQSQLKPSGEMKFDLLYGPADNTNTGVPDDKYVRIVQIGAAHFHATLTHEADANIDINIHAEVFNDSCVSQCTGADDTWQIPMGAREANYTFANPPGNNLCTPMLANYKNLITISVVTAGWDYSFEPDPLFDYDTLC